MMRYVLAIQLLKDRQYRNYWIALFISQLGTWMQAATQGWLVLELTGSAERLGLVIALQFLPSLLFSIPAGVISDRYPRRDLLFVTQTGLALTAMGMFGLIVTDLIRYEHMLVFALLYGLFTAVDLPVRQAFTVELAGRERYPGAIALNSFGFNTSRVVGPAIAGLLIAAVGLSWSYLFNALSFVPMIVVLFRIPREKIEAKTSSPVHDALEGIRYVWNQPLIRQVTLLVGLTSLFGMNFQTIVPAYARLELNLNAQGFGLLMSAVGVGSIFASLWQAVAAKARPIRAVWGNLVLGVSLILLVFPMPVWGTAVVLALAGFGMITTMVNSNTTVQLLAPDHLRGRIMSVYSMVLLGVGPLGAYLSGFLLQQLGGHWGAAVLGVITLGSGLIMLRNPWPQTVKLPTPAAADD